MNVTISLFWIMILIIVIHTTFTHLINWMWRGIEKSNDDSVIGAGIIVTIVEIVLLILGIDAIT